MVIIVGTNMGGRVGRKGVLTVLGGGIVGRRDRGRTVLAVNLSSYRITYVSCGYYAKRNDNNGRVRRSCGVGR